MNKTELAYNFYTSPETLEGLANDENGVVRLCVAENPNTIPEILDRLANDKNDWVRDAVVQNPNTPQYLKDYLKFSSFLDLCQNFNCPFALDK